MKCLLFGATMAAVIASVPGLHAQAPSGGLRTVPRWARTTSTTIQGNTLNSTNGRLSNVTVRLRDARMGRIVDMQQSDRAGLFAFRNIDPGSYVVELIGANQTVVAASQLINVEAGSIVSAVVKMPFRVPPLAGLIGQTPGSAATVTAAAASSGVLAAQITGQPLSSVTPF